MLMPVFVVLTTYCRCHYDCDDGMTEVKMIVVFMAVKRTLFIMIITMGEDE